MRRSWGSLAGIQGGITFGVVIDSTMNAEREVSALSDNLGVSRRTTNEWQAAMSSNDWASSSMS